MTRKGQGQIALGAGVVFSAIGGIFGTIVLVTAAPALAEVALKLQLVRVFLAGLPRPDLRRVHRARLAGQGGVSLLIGLLAAMIGMENPAAFPRFSFGSIDLSAGIDMIPAMIGMFAIAEILRCRQPVEHRICRRSTARAARIFAGQWTLIKKYPMQWLRGSAVGTLIGALPGAGCDIAAWIAYGISKRFSKEPEKFGTGHVEGIVESGAANNAAVQRHLDPGAGVRHSRRLDHRDRDRRAVPEEPQSRADDLPAAARAGDRGLHGVLPRQHAAWCRSAGWRSSGRCTSCACRARS